MKRFAPLALLLVLLVLALTPAALGEPATWFGESRLAGRSGAQLPGVAGGGSVSATPTDPAGYRESLQAALADLEREGGAGVADAVLRLRAVGPAEMPDGTIVHPALSSVISDLEAQPPDVEAAATRLRALTAELDRAYSTTGGGSDPEDALRRVLERPEFRAEVGSDPVAEFFQWLSDLAGEWLDRLLGPPWHWLVERLGRALGVGFGGVDLRQVLSIGGLLVVVALGVWAVRRLRRAMGPSTVALALQGSASSPTAEAVRAEAIRLAEKGDFRAAIRAHYLSVLMRWEEMGRLAFDRSLTNRELLARAGSGPDPSLGKQLAPMVERFDGYWYGWKLCSSQDYSDFSRLAAAAWEASP